MSTGNVTPIRIVVGGQYGSEAKGMVAAELCRRENIDYAVRTGGVNAGHTVIFRDQAFKMQQLPTGWVNPHTRLVIGPGAYINVGILDREINIINDATGGYVENRLIIDPRAGIHHDEYGDRSAASGRHHAFGATGKGCSEAMMERIRARKEAVTNSDANVTFGDDWPNKLYRDSFGDTEELLNNAYDFGESILIEGTQGQMLDIILGPWPYTTHKPTSPAQWIVECGLSPTLKYEVVGVYRTYPIRVAGNSGPLPGEMGWVELVERWDKARGTIKNFSLIRYKEVCALVGEELAHLDKLPRYTDTAQPNYQFENWSAEMRVRYREGLSEFHKVVLDSMSKADQMHLATMMEFTTVTKKMRRIARWDADAMKASIRQVRPTYVVLTFLNYVFPELSGVTRVEDLHDKARYYVSYKEKELGTEIRYVSTGPKGECMIDLRGGA